MCETHVNVICAFAGQPYSTVYNKNMGMTRIKRYISFVLCICAKIGMSRVALLKHGILNGKFRFAYAAPACTVNRNASRRILSSTDVPFRTVRRILRPTPGSRCQLARSLQTPLLVAPVVKCRAFGPVEVSEVHCARRICRCIPRSNHPVASTMNARK